jgi:hypothetical protein
MATPSRTPTSSSVCWWLGHLRDGLAPGRRSQIWLAWIGPRENEASTPLPRPDYPIDVRVLASFRIACLRLALRSHGWSSAAEAATRITRVKVGEGLEPCDGPEVTYSVFAVHVAAGIFKAV